MGRHKPSMGTLCQGPQDISSGELHRLAGDVQLARSETPRVDLQGLPDRGGCRRGLEPGPCTVRWVTSEC
jgi:hypothetical protein